MFHGLDTQVCGDTKCSQMGTHQPGYVDKHRYNRKQYCHPAITGQVLCLVKIRCHLQYFPDHFPDVIERHQGNQALIAESTRKHRSGTYGCLQFPADVINWIVFSKKSLLLCIYVKAKLPIVHP